MLTISCPFMVSMWLYTCDNLWHQQCKLHSKIHQVSSVCVHGKWSKAMGGAGLQTCLHFNMTVTIFGTLLPKESKKVNFKCAMHNKGVVIVKPSVYSASYNTMFRTSLHVSYSVVLHNHVNIQCLVFHVPKPSGGCLQWLSESQIQLLLDRSLHCSLSMSQTVTQWHLL